MAAESEQARTVCHCIERLLPSPENEIKTITSYLVCTEKVLQKKCTKIIVKKT